MFEPDLKSHWENIYRTKRENEFSWFQEYPAISMEFIQSFQIPPDTKILDVGGGDSRLADSLLALGYRNISVLDISEKAIERAKKRMETKAEKINWIIGDITELKTDIKFDLWHDRAVFHFLTDPNEAGKYLSVARKEMKPGGYLVIGTFSEKGPKKCSGLPVKQYSDKSLSAFFANGFSRINCKEQNHITPSASTQNFLFCSFRKI